MLTKKKKKRTLNGLVAATMVTIAIDSPKDTQMGEGRTQALYVLSPLNESCLEIRGPSLEKRIERKANNANDTVRKIRLYEARNAWRRFTRISNWVNYRRCVQRSEGIYRASRVDRSVQ